METAKHKTELDGNKWSVLFSVAYVPLTATRHKSNNLK